MSIHEIEELLEIIEELLLNAICDGDIVDLFSKHFYFLEMHVEMIMDNVI